MTDLKDAARIMGVSVQAMYLRIQKGLLPQIVKKGGRWKVPNEIIEPYIGTLSINQAHRFMLEHGGPKAKYSIYRYVEEGRFNPVWDPMGRPRIKRSELEELLGFSERKGLKRAERQLRP